MSPNKSMSVNDAVAIHDRSPLNDLDLFTLATWIRNTTSEERGLFSQLTGDHSISNIRWHAERRGWVG